MLVVAVLTQTVIMSDYVFPFKTFPAFPAAEGERPYSFTEYDDEENNEDKSSPDT